MALSEEQIARIRAYARALQGDPNAAPTQPLPAPQVPPQPGTQPARSYLTNPIETAGPTGPLRTPAPPDPEAEQAQREKRSRVVRTFVRHLGKWDSNLGGRIPTPGGLAPWLFAFLFLIFAVVPFNGRSRLEWMWLALTGSASLPGTRTPGESADAAQRAILNLPGVTGVVDPSNWLQVPVGGVNLPVFFPRQLVP